MEKWKYSSVALQNLVIEHLMSITLTRKDILKTHQV